MAAKGGGKYGGTLGDDAVSAMKNWASRLLAEESASRMWYKDWGFLATGDPNDRQGENIDGRLAAAEKELAILEAKAKAAGGEDKLSKESVLIGTSDFQKLQDAREELQAEKAKEKTL